MKEDELIINIDIPPITSLDISGVEEKEIEPTLRLLERILQNATEDAVEKFHAFLNAQQQETAAEPVFNTSDTREYRRVTNAAGNSILIPEVLSNGVSTNAQQAGTISFGTPATTGSANPTSGRRTERYFELFDLQKKNELNNENNPNEKASVEFSALRTGASFENNYRNGINTGGSVELSLGNAKASFEIHVSESKLGVATGGKASAASVNIEKHIGYGDISLKTGTEVELLALEAYLATETNMGDGKFGFVTEGRLGASVVGGKVYREFKSPFLDSESYAGAAFGLGANGGLGVVLDTNDRTYRVKIELGIEALDFGIDTTIKYGAIWDAAKDVAKDVWDTAEDAAKSIWDTTKDVAKGVWGTTQDAAKGVWGTTQDVAKGVWDTANEAAKGVWGTAQDVAKGVWDTTQDAAKGVWDTTQDVAKGIWDTAKGAAEGVWGTAKDAAEGIWGTAKDAAKGVWGTARNAAKDVWGTDKGVWDIAQDAAKGVWGTAKDATKGVKNTAKNAAKGVWDTTQDVAKGAKNTAQKAVKGVKNTTQIVAKGAKNTVQKAVKGVRNTANIVAEGTKNTVQKAVKGVSNTANIVVEGTKNTAQKAVKDVSNTANIVAKGAKNTFNNFFIHMTTEKNKD